VWCASPFCVYKYSQKEIAMARATGGFEYEAVIASILKENGLMDPNATTAGSSADDPDAYIYSASGKEISIEIKKDKGAFFGQAELKYINKQWQLSENTKRKYPNTAKQMETVTVTSDGKTYSSLIDFVNKNWPAPHGKNYEVDLKRLGNLYAEFPTASVGEHYAKDRKTPYIQIGKAGLFHFERDVLKLGTSKFSAKIQARSRVKYRSKTSYGFLIALSIKGSVTASLIDIEKDIKAIKKAIK
jgi:hypothetical protein